MPKQINIYVIVLFALVSILALILFFWPQAAASSKSFAQCLTDSGVTMYGADSCVNCAEQKKIFGDDFRFVHYVNCEFEQELCSDKGISVYPLWSKDNKAMTGLQSFGNLSEFSGCFI